MIRQRRARQPFSLCFSPFPLSPHLHNVVQVVAKTRSPSVSGGIEGGCCCGHQELAAELARFSGWRCRRCLRRYYRTSVRLGQSAIADGREGRVLWCNGCGEEDNSAGRYSTGMLEKNNLGSGKTAKLVLRASMRVYLHLWWASRPCVSGPT